MFVLFYLQLRWFDPSQAREMRRGIGGGFVSFSEGKETKDRAASFSFALSASPFPSFPRPPLPPSCSPSGIRIHPYLSSRRGRGPGSSASFSEKKEREERAAPLSLAPLSSSFLTSPPFYYFISYSPCYPPLRRDACIVACVPSRVDCCICFVLFDPPWLFCIISAVPPHRLRKYCQ